MKNQYSELIELGWNDWFAQRANCKSTESVARVAAVDRDQLLLVDQSGHFRAKLAGRYLHHHHLKVESHSASTGIGALLVDSKFVICEAVEVEEC